MSAVLALVAVASAVPPADTSAQAVDQAFVVSLPVAKAAVAVLNRHAWSARFCEPCGDASPEVVGHAVASARPWEHDRTQWVVTVDGADVDLAYVYVPLPGSGLAANLAMPNDAAPVTGVSPTVTVEMWRDKP